MSLIYDGTDGLFTHLGKLIEHYDATESQAVNPTTGLEAMRNDLLDAFQAAGQDIAIDGLVNAVERWKDEQVGRRAELVEYAVRRLQDEGTVLKELGVNSPELLSQGFAEFNQGVFGQFEIENDQKAESIRLVLEEKAKKLDSKYVVTLLEDRKCSACIIAEVELKEFKNAGESVVCDRRTMLSFCQTMFESDAANDASQSKCQSTTRRNGKQKRASRGRPTQRNFKADKKLVEDWNAAKASGNNRTRFCQSKGIRLKDLEAAQRSVNRRK